MTYKHEHLEVGGKVPKLTEIKLKSSDCLFEDTIISTPSVIVLKIEEIALCVMSEQLK